MRIRILIIHFSRLLSEDALRHSRAHIESSRAELAQA